MKKYNAPAIEIIVPSSADCITASGGFSVAASGSGNAIWDWDDISNGI